MRSGQSAGDDRRRRQGGVDDVEVVVRRTPRLRCPARRRWRPAGPSPRLTGSRSSRRACSTWRRPLPATRAATVSTATPADDHRRRGSGRRGAAVSVSPPRGGCSSSGAVSTRSVTIQVISPTISDERRRDARVRESQHGEQRRSPVSTKKTTSGTSGKRRIQVAAYPQMPSTTTRRCRPAAAACPPTSTRWTRKIAIGPGVKSRTAAPTASTGLDSARRAIAAAWLSARPAAPATTPGEREPPARDRVHGCAEAPRVALAATVRSGSRTSDRPRPSPGSPLHRGASGQLPPPRPDALDSGHDRAREPAHRHRHGRPPPRTRSFDAGGRTGLARGGTSVPRATPTATSCCTPSATRCSPRRAWATSAATSVRRTRSGPAPPATTCSPRRCAGSVPPAGRWATSPAS